MGADDARAELRRLESVLSDVADGCGALRAVIDAAGGGGDPGAEVAMATEARPLDPSSPLAMRARKIDVLRHALQVGSFGLVPQLHPGAPLGHAYPAVEDILRVPPGHAIDVLEELCDLGLLKRKLHNRVHSCPKCRCCQINFRETCDTCDSIDLSIERLIHHFACAHIGLELEFVDGMDLRCPKCRHRLFQLGQDFDRPHETYLCHSCTRVTESPAVMGQCLTCANVFGLRDAHMADIHSFTTTELAPRAVELGRLTGLQVAELLFDPEVRLARLEYLLLEARREFHRMERYAGSVSFAILRWTEGGQPFPLFREAPARAIQDLGRTLASSLRDLDLAAPAHSSALVLLLPETNLAGAKRVAERLEQAMAEVSVQAGLGQRVAYEWEFHGWDEAPADPDAAVELLRAEDRG